MGLVVADKRVRYKVFCGEWRRSVLKSLIFVRFDKKGFGSQVGKTMLASSSVVRVRNRCLVTARSKSVFTFCRVSDLVLREQLIKGAVCGFVKSKSR